VKSDWAGKAERGSKVLIALIVWLARTAGRSLCRALLYPIVGYFMLTDRTARTASREFLTAVHRRPARRREVFAHIHCFAATLLDRVFFAAGEFDRFEVTIEGLAWVDRALRDGRGCVLLGSHLGNFDLMMLAQRALDGRPISVLMRVDPRARVRKLAGIDDQALDMIELGRPDSYLRAHEALERGSIVALLADRVDHGVATLRAQFFERATTWPLAPHVLAARSGAPILMCFGLYEGDNRYRIEFVPLDASVAQQARGAALQPLVDRYAALLEDYARRYPLNWFNFYPYWGKAEAVT
jgi:predicted LPLAT superfamily acyltransferase